MSTGGTPADVVRLSDRYRVAVTSLMIRRTRLVPIGPAAAPPQHLVDVLVEDGLVTTIASHLDPRPGVEEYGADGRWCAPGLWDQHVHFTQWTLASQRLDLAPARSPEQVLALVVERLTALPGVPVVGWGHRPGGWDRDVTVSELDAVSGDTPVVLIAGDGHHAWLNTTALLHLAMPVRDSVVRENEWFSVLDEAEQEQFLAALHRLQDSLREVG